MLNVVVLMGRLTADPEVKTTPNGNSVCSFSIAVNRSYDREKTDFVDVVAWRNTAEFVGKYFSKGQMIVVKGALQTRTYEDKEGQKRKITEVLAENVEFGESKKPEDGLTKLVKKAQNLGIEVDVDEGSSMSDDDLPF